MHKTIQGERVGKGKQETKSVEEEMEGAKRGDRKRLDGCKKENGNG